MKGFATQSRSATPVDGTACDDRIEETLTVRGEPLVVVEPLRQVDQLAEVQLGQLALQQRLLQVQLGVPGRVAVALLAPRLPATNTWEPLADASELSCGAARNSCQWR